MSTSPPVRYARYLLNLPRMFLSESWLAVVEVGVVLDARGHVLGHVPAGSPHEPELQVVAAAGGCARTAADR
jgi:hypothetical protein